MALGQRLFALHSSAEKIATCADGPAYSLFAGNHSRLPCYAPHTVGGTDSRSSVGIPRHSSPRLQKPPRPGQTVWVFLTYALTTIIWGRFPVPQNMHVRRRSPHDQILNFRQPHSWLDGSMPAKRYRRSHHGYRPKPAIREREPDF